MPLLVRPETRILYLRDVVWERSPEAWRCRYRRKYVPKGELARWIRRWRGEVAFKKPGELPNDGKVIEDAKKYH